MKVFKISEFWRQVYQMGLINRNRREALENRELLIRTTAYKLWEEDGKPGYWFAAKSDYYKSKAIEKLNSEKIQLHNYFLDPLIRTEKRLEKLLAFLKSLAILEILEKLGYITILFGVISFIATEEQRRNTEIYQAWQVITAAYEQPGSGGRKEALEFLNSQPRKFPFIWQKWSKQSLAGLDVSNAYFHKIVLKEADLRYADLQKTDLRYAEFQEANLNQATLIKANLYGGDLRSADLRGADLRGADLTKADLRGADLTKANLSGADSSRPRTDLSEADLRGAYLAKANLRFADLRGADLRGADLSGTDLRGAVLMRTIISIDTIEPKQIKSACSWEQAIYVEKWNLKEELEKLIEAIEPKNIQFIEDLRNDISSDNKNSEDCPF